MLPFTKRSARDEASDLINTGDIEVVRPHAKVSPPADRPRVFSRSVSDEEMTTLMPRKGPLAAFLKQQQAPAPRSARPKPVLMEEPTRAFVRPPAAPAPSIAPMAMTPPAPMPQPVHAAYNAPTAPAVPASLPKPHARTQAAPRQEMRPGLVDSVAPVAKQDSDAKIDPPATVITTRTRLIAPRPTVSWAAALVAMGVFVGLVTAVIARGDADSLIDATASFVDPSGSHASAGGASLMGAQQKFVAPVPLLPSMSMDTQVAPKDEEPKSVALADLPTASPAPQKPAPVAYAAPVWRPSRIARPARAAAPKEPKEKVSEEKVAVAAAPKPAPAAKPHAAPAAAPKASEDDVESASAADALAKAQLEASLK